MAYSPTGSGKTLAYLLPILSSLGANGSLQAVVLVSSQELSQQVTQVARNFTEGSELHVLQLGGSANIHRQIERLRKSLKLSWGHSAG